MTTSGLFAKMETLSSGSVASGVTTASITGTGTTATTAIPWGGSPATPYPTYSAPTSTEESIKSFLSLDLQGALAHNRFNEMLFVASGAISKSLERSVIFSIDFNYYSDTHEVEVYLRGIFGAFNEKTLVRVSRPMTHATHAIMQTLAAELMNLVILEGLMNIVRAELKLKNEPEF